MTHHKATLLATLYEELVQSFGHASNNTPQVVKRLSCDCYLCPRLHTGHDKSMHLPTHSTHLIIQNTCCSCSTLLEIHCLTITIFELFINSIFDFLCTKTKKNAAWQNVTTHCKNESKIHIIHADNLRIVDSFDNEMVEITKYTNYIIHHSYPTNLDRYWVCLSNSCVLSPA